MIDVDWRVHETGDVALVAAVVENTAPTPRRIALDPRIDGTVLPPRWEGLHEPGWSDEGYAGVVPADDRLSLGFACRGAVEDPPVVVVDEGRAPPDGGDTAESDAPTPTTVLRDLGSPVPPRDAVPDGVDSSGSSLSESSESSPVDPSASAGRRQTEEPPSREPGTDPPHGPDPGDDDSRPVPGPVGDWLDDVASRVDRAERLAAGRDLGEAAAAVAAAGGLVGVERLVDGLEADEAALRAVADRATELADACAVREDVPADAYRELA